MFLLDAIHHCEEFFPNPEVYDPERFMPENRDKLVPYSYIPFGAGPRNCELGATLMVVKVFPFLKLIIFFLGIGMRFALTEAKMGLSQMLSQFEFVKNSKTTDKLTILSSNVLLKTSPINLSAVKRS